MSEENKEPLSEASLGKAFEKLAALENKQPQVNEIKLLGDRILLAMVRTPAKYGSEDLQLYVPSIARDVMNMGVVKALSSDAARISHAQVGDVIMVKPYKGQHCSDGMVQSFGLDLRKHWNIYSSEDVLAIVTSDFRV